MRPNELHNQLKDEIITVYFKKVFETFPHITDRLIMLETIVAAYICFLSRNPDHQTKLLQILTEGIQVRLEEITKLPEKN